MKSIIGDSLKSARAQSQMYVRAIGTGGDSGNPLGLGAGAGGNLAFGNKRSDMTVHQEQYRHNTGWVAASIAPIAKRIARQPMRLARTRATTAPTKAPGPVGTKGVTAEGELRAKPWERSTDPRKIASEVWFARALPGVFKSVAKTAELIDTHPILDAIDDPNPIMVRWSLMFATVASLMLTGKAYWWVKARERETDGNGADGAPPRIEIWPLPSNWVKPVHTKDTLNHHWEVTPDGALEPTPVPAEQIVYFYFPDPSAILGSQSPLQNQSRAVVSDEAIAEAQRRGFANGVFPGVAVVVGRQPDIDGRPGERPVLNRDQRAQILTAFKQAYRGVYNHDEPIILDQLIQDVKRVTNTNREMDFRESGQYTKERITQGFGVNPIVMGQVEGANRASSATADDHLCQSTVNPIIELISQTLTAWLNPILAAPGERLYLFIEEARAVDPDSDRADWLALATAGACNRDELRAGLRQLPPMEAGTKAYIASTLVPIDARLASDVPPAPPKPVLPLAAPAPDSSDAPPAKPTQTSEPPITGERIAEFVGTLAKLEQRRFTVTAAKSVLWATFSEVPDRVIDRILAVCSHGEHLSQLSGWVIGFVARILRTIEAPDPLAQEFEIPVRDVRQERPFDCGAAVAYSAADALGVPSMSYADFMTALDTTADVGTQPSDLFAFFAHHGCDPLERKNRTIEHLRRELKRGRLCICPVQYFGDGLVAGGEGGDKDSGHYVLVNGFTADSIKYQCPIDGPGSILATDFLGNWYDRDQDGRPYVRYALSIGPAPRLIDDPIDKSVKLVDSSGHEHAADGKFGHGGSSAAKPKPGGEITGAPHATVSSGGHGTGSVADKIGDLDTKASGFLDKLKAHGAKAVAAAKHAGEKLHQLAIKASWHAMTGNLADDICDTSHDYSKLINAKGTGDWLSEHLGVSGNFAAKASSMAMSFAYTALKSHIAKRRAARAESGKWAGDLWTRKADEVDSVSIREAAQQITDIQVAFWSAMGMPSAQLPKVEDVQAWLIKRHDDKFKPTQSSESKVQDSSGHDHDNHGLFTGPGGSGSGKPQGNQKPAPAKPKPAAKPPGKRNSPKKSGSRPAPIAEKKPSAKANKAKASMVPVGRTVQRYAEEHNEPRFAKVLGGQSHSLPDSEPLDVNWKDKSGKQIGNVELKTIILQKNDKITMDSYSQVRKTLKEQETGAAFHSVFSDDRKVFGAKGDIGDKNPGDPGYKELHDDSKREYYYRRGIAGSARLGSMYKCKNEAELKRMMSLPDEQLPEAAKRTDAHLFVGKWQAKVIDGKKAFVNKKTGKVVKAKE